jgi:quinoprotein glucose dehydrogenase
MRRPILAGVTAALLALSGILLLVGGCWLVVVGGSWYYVIAGALLLACAWLLWRGHPASLWLMAALFAGTLVWAWWESGVDWWPLAARLGVLFMLCVLMILPWTMSRTGRGVQAGRFALALAMGAFVVVAIASWVHDPHARQGTLASRTAPVGPGPVAAADWPAYGGSPFGQRYSALRQITPQNVTKLQPVWHYQSGDMRGQPGDPKETTYEVTPLKIGNRLFLCTPHQNVVALDATTGEQIWRYEAKVRGELALQHLTCRGLTFAPGSGAATAGQPAVAVAPPQPAASAAAPSNPIGTGASVDGASPHGGTPPGAAPPDSQQPLPVAAATSQTDAHCASRLFLPTADGRLVALNPDTGHVCADFGGGTGQINLWEGMPNYRPGSYYSTSPVVATRKLVIVGGTVLDNVSTHEQSGVIRAFDIDTGRLVWNWDSGNPDQTAPLPPGQTYTVNSPNSWSISAVDEALGLVYVPLGNQTPDQWGANRSPAVEHYSSSIVALDVATGKVRWSFQTVHHDLWDYDVPAQPSLLDLRVGSTTVPVLVQPTKQGELFVLDRRTGQPVLPVTEQRAPQGAVQGDHSAATQPRSQL